MSFAGTPLGQDRRLDHQTFLKRSSLAFDHTKPTTSPPRRVATINSIPLSYTYGAPTVGTHSPTASPRARRNASPSRTDSLLNRPNDGSVDEDELLNSRYNFLKQRNESLANRPGASAGPGVITTPPRPSAATLKDTSVNIASAFEQEANTYAMNSNMSRSNSQRALLPRSTSVEYEEQSRSTSHRRLAVPPNRTGARGGGGATRPPSKVGSTTRGSDVENEMVAANGRGKSPFDLLTDYARKAVAPATEIFMKQRTPEPEPDEIHIPRQATDTTLVGQNTSSYDYAEEEADYQQTLEKKNLSAAQKRNRMSADNKAYRPTASDLEESSEEEDGGEQRGRRRRNKKKDVSGLSTSLPTIQYDKRKRRKGRGDKGDGSVEEDGSIGEEVVEQASLRSTTPLQRQASVPRASAPPSRRGSVPLASSNTVDTSGVTENLHYDSGLPSISEDVEAEDQSLYDLEAVPSRRSQNRRARSLSRTRSTTRRGFSIGAFLGFLVNLFYRLCHGIILFIVRAIALVTLGAGRVLGFIFNIFVRQPTLYVRNARRRSMNFGKYFVMGTLLCLAWYILQNPSTLKFSFGTRRTRPAHFPIPSDYSEGTVEALNERILFLENKFADLYAESQNALDHEKQKSRDLMNRINQLETRVDKEVLRAYQNEESTRVAASKNLESLQREISVLKIQQAETDVSTDTTGVDEEARKKLEALESRLYSVEGEVKDALELGQSAVKAGSVAASAASGTHWWNKVGSGSSGVTIKTGDGEDVTSLVEHLVENSVAQHIRKDGLARVDFALNSAGAGVIPSLTSPTYHVQPKAFFGLISGAARYARSPVNALNHETQVGYCWPFFGSQGQLGVQLADRVFITDVTIDHIAKEVAHDLRTTPRQMEVWGLLEGKDNWEKYAEYEASKAQARADGAELPDEPEYPANLPRSRDVRYVPVTSFVYDIHAPSDIQTYSVPQEIQDLGIDFGVVVLVVKSNWGSETLTCLYRFRVHGTRALEIPAPDL